ncbi:MAG: MFS transporter [Proteobacteria bacterium]|nr:MFS transporter [Pseudomonadota bacterium]
MTEKIKEIFSNTTLVALLFLSFYAGYIVTINGVGSAEIGREFNLDKDGITFIYGIFFLGGVIALFLNRLVDRIGRRRMLLFAFASATILSLVSAFSPTVEIYTGAQIVVNSLYWVIFTTSAVMLAENLPPEQRATGQSFGGMFFILGAGLTAITIAIYKEFEKPFAWLHSILSNFYSEDSEVLAFVDSLGPWRLAWVLGFVALIVYPLLSKGLVESDLFLEVESSGKIHKSHWTDLFKGKYRSRTILLLFAQFTGMIAITVGTNWLFYFQIEILNMTQADTTIVVTGGGLPAILGFTIGAIMCDRIGRRPTIIISTAFAMFTGIGYYTFGYHEGLLRMAELVGFIVLYLMAENMVQIALRNQMTELFPTDLRATYTGFGSCVQALGGVTANLLFSYLIFSNKTIVGDSEFLKSIEPFVLAIVLVIATRLFAIVAYCFIPETKGVSLDKA